MLACVIGVAGTELSRAEARFLTEISPAGIILFARNVTDPRQLRILTEAIRTAAAPARPLIFVDQEGGKVMRLRPPGWRDLPAMAGIGRLYSDDPTGAARVARVVGRLIGADLVQAGIDVACAPVLDVAAPGLTDAIGTRAFSADAATTSILGRAVADGLLEAGVLPVIKHLPGHGRAQVDSHVGLPVVTASYDELASRDFQPFRDLNHLPIGMTAHVLYPALDPMLPATMSARIIEDIVRAEIGFDGLLLSDDLGMGALSGDLCERAKACLTAGCDLALACSGRIEDSIALGDALPSLSRAAAARFARAVAVADAGPHQLDVASDEHHLALARLVA